MLGKHVIGVSSVFWVVVFFFIKLRNRLYKLLRKIYLYLPFDAFKPEKHTKSMSKRPPHSQNELHTNVCVAFSDRHISQQASLALDSGRLGYFVALSLCSLCG